MRSFLIPVLTALVLPVTGLVGCGSKDDQAQTAQQPAASSTTHAADSAAVVNVDWCIVSGETLGSMGDPVHYKYKDRDITFCCKNCVKDFEAEPIMYLARLDSAQAGLIEQPVEQEGHSQ